MVLCVSYEITKLGNVALCWAVAGMRGQRRAIWQAAASSGLGLRSLGVSCFSFLDSRQLAPRHPSLGTESVASFCDRLGQSLASSGITYLKGLEKPSEFLHPASQELHRSPYRAARDDHRWFVLRF